jgi:hypothetical protein
LYPPATTFPTFFPWREDRGDSDKPFSQGGQIKEQIEAGREVKSDDYKNNEIENERRKMLLEFVKGHLRKQKWRASEYRK